MANALFAAMAKAFPAIEGATKDSNNPHFNKKYADLSSVVEAIKPALIENGLFFTQLTHEQQGGVCVETVVHHAEGDSMSFGKLFVPASKNDAQGYGSALTYARRYSLMTAFGVCPEDDDGNAAAKAPRDPDPRISDEQRGVLFDLAQKSGADMKGFCTYYKVESLPELPATKYDHAKAMLEKKLVEKTSQTAQAAADQKEAA